jgi:hypothetical protein
MLLQQIKNAIPFIKMALTAKDAGFLARVLGFWQFFGVKVVGQDHKDLVAKLSKVSNPGYFAWVVSKENDNSWYVLPENASLLTVMSHVLLKPALKMPSLVTGKNEVPRKVFCMEPVKTGSLVYVAKVTVTTLVY